MVADDIRRVPSLEPTKRPPARPSSLSAVPRSSPIGSAGSSGVLGVLGAVGGVGAPSAPAPVVGIHRAVVVGALDPLQQGRLQVEVPGLGLAATWAEACLPPVSDARVLLPGVGQSVWVAFAGGDVGHPVWTGVTWETAAATPVASTDRAGEPSP